MVVAMYAEKTTQGRRARVTVTIWRPHDTNPTWLQMPAYHDITWWVDEVR